MPKNKICKYLLKFQKNSDKIRDKKLIIENKKVPKEIGHLFLNGITIKNNKDTNKTIIGFPV